MAGSEDAPDSLKIHYSVTAPIALDVAFEVRGFTALLGRSGAGKTTLLKALAGLLPAAGAPWSGLPPQARPIGYLPQGSALFPHLTALENAAFSLRGADRLAKAQALLDDLGVGVLAARPAAELSGGEAQRVALARALARQPALLLLDEPSAALDGATRDAVLAQLIETVDAQKIPALAATHDPAIAGLADWLVLLADGKIIREGTPRDVFGDPRSVAAASLLGFQNIWEQDGVTKAIRAADIVIAESGVPATVLSCRAHGSDLRLECALPQRITVLVQDGDPSRYAPGQRIHLVFPAEKTKILTQDL
jgi:molybdate transport system ATP-binding protein